MHRIDDLLRYFSLEPAHPLAGQLAAWMTDSARFHTFVDGYRDKIRKKVRLAQDAEALADLHAELVVAWLLFQDRRCSVEYEKLGVRQRRAPDLTGVFKTHTLFNVEVTRLRTANQANEDVTLSITQKLINTLCDKVGQLPPSVVNVLACVTNQTTFSSTEVRRAMMVLQERAAQRDDPFFQRRGLDDARHFHRQQQRLSAVLLCTLNQQNQILAIHLWPDPQARHPLPTELKNLLLALV